MSSRDRLIVGCKRWVPSSESESAAVHQYSVRSACVINAAASRHTGDRSPHTLFPGFGCSARERPVLAPCRPFIDGFELELNSQQALLLAAVDIGDALDERSPRRP